MGDADFLSYAERRRPHTAEAADLRSRISPPVAPMLGLPCHGRDHWFESGTAHHCSGCSAASAANTPRSHKGARIRAPTTPALGSAGPRWRRPFCCDGLNGLSESDPLPGRPLVRPALGGVLKTYGPCLETMAGVTNAALLSATHRPPRRRRPGLG